MKKLIIASLLVAGTLPVLAEPLTCSQTVNGKSYSVTYDGSTQTAKVEVNGKPGQFSAMKCRSSEDNPGGPDSLKTINCYTPGVADAGYLLRIRIGGIVGFREAELGVQTIAGPRVLAPRMNCR